MGMFCFSVGHDILLDSASFDGSSVVLKIKYSANQLESTKILKNHLKEKLVKNRVINIILKNLENENELLINHISKILINSFPYISANSKTWDTYSYVLMDWLDVADLALFDRKEKTLSEYAPTSQIKQRLLHSSRRESGKMPTIQFNPVVEVAKRIEDALSNQQSVDWSGISRTTVNKSLSVLEDMKLIIRKSQSIIVNPECKIFATDEARRIEIAKKAILNMEYFPKFLELLNDVKDLNKSHRELAEMLRIKINADWKLSTAEVSIKILLDWARKLMLAPSKYAETLRGRPKLS